VISSVEEGIYPEYLSGAAEDIDDQGLVVEEVISSAPYP
jgi:hypothetical protein